jgi:hypothetical protein
LKRTLILTALLGCWSGPLWGASPPLVPPGDRQANIARRSEDEETASLEVSNYKRRDGWLCAETVNFSIYHNQSKEFARKVAEVAERTRRWVTRKWFDGIGEDWDLRCVITLYATAQDYSRATGLPAASRGRSYIRTDQGHVVGRCIDLHCDDTETMLLTVLPHETTHVVLAGKFGKQQIPRWADEGMAMLSEPRERVELYLQNLPRYEQEQRLFHVRDLMQLTEYPESRYLGAFYAQSVSLVEFLNNERGASVFAQFLCEVGKDGYMAALKRHYGYRTFEELQAKWSQKALGDDMRRR